MTFLPKCVLVFYNDSINLKHFVVWLKSKNFKKKKKLNMTNITPFIFCVDFSSNGLIFISFSTEMIVFYS